MGANVICFTFLLGKSVIYKIASFFFQTITLNSFLSIDKNVCPNIIIKREIALIYKMHF